MQRSQNEGLCHVNATSKVRSAGIIMLVLFPVVLFAQYPVDRNLDVQHYYFSIVLSDATDSIHGDAEITMSLKNNIREATLDLQNVNTEGKGMKVDRVTVGATDVLFTHENNRLHLTLPATTDGLYKINIRYAGIPANGLIIGKNKYGDRTFFGDNYPDRARNWLPCVDHPSDKASVTWAVTAPDHYQVVGSGKLKEETNLDHNLKYTRWEMEAPISTKVMVIGVARFAVDYVGEATSTPIQTWVYPQNRAEGFYDFAPAVDIMNWLKENVGPYAYEKLANVQSKTTYGGMENASNIFYFENSVNGKQEREGLMVHEMAHQWFGNSATEADWPHAWLSEGFATYMTLLYNEAKHGQAKMVAGLKDDRKAVIAYWKQMPLPVVNTKLVSFPSVSGLRVLLNKNTYDKGGWVLHMLRKKLGDEVFWKVIRTYYAEYMNRVATTEDFRAIVEKVSGADMKLFFDQWLYRGGQPELAGSWKYKNGEVVVELTQKQEVPFVIDVELGIVGEKGDTTFLIVPMKSSTGSARLKFPKQPSRVVIDPNTILLYDGPELLGN